MNVLKRILRHTFGMFLALWLLAEDAFWGVLEKLTAWASRWVWLKNLECRLSACPPYVALSLFLLPGLALLPFKLLGLWLMGNHQYALGVATFVLAKVTGTALGARLFVVLKPTLMTLPWFAKGWEKFILWKMRVVDFAKTSYTYRMLLVIKKKCVRLKQRWVEKLKTVWTD